MTQADLVRLYFNKESAYNSWDYCFNQQCPLAQECAHYLSVTYKKPEQTKGYAIYPDAYHDNKCEHFLQLQMMKMAYGFMDILEELKHKDEASFRVHMTSYFGSKTSYYRYKLGQTGLVPEQQQYVRAASQNASVVIIPTPSLLISFIPSLWGFGLASSPSPIALKAPMHPSGLSFTRTFPKSNMIFLYCIIYTLL